MVKFSFSYIIIILLLLIFTLGYKLLVCKNTIVKNFIHGLWVADTSFCKQSNIDSLLLYINTDNQCYILGEKDNDIFINDMSEVILNSQISTNSDNYHTLDVEFPNIEYKEFPKKQKMRIYIYTGKMILYDKNDVTYGVFYKDPLLSEQMFLA